jgi:hypothetical protein
LPGQRELGAGRPVGWIKQCWCCSDLAIYRKVIEP